MGIKENQTDVRKDLSSMELHETRGFKDGSGRHVIVMRVVEGWMYTIDGRDTFVPKMAGSVLEERLMDISRSIDMADDRLDMIAEKLDAINSSL